MCFKPFHFGTEHADANVCDSDGVCNYGSTARAEKLVSMFPKRMNPDTVVYKITTCSAIFHLRDVTAVAVIALRTVHFSLNTRWLAATSLSEPCADAEAYGSTYVVGVTDGVMVWAVQFSKLFITAVQWQYGDVLTAPSGDTNSVFKTIQTSGYSLNVTVWTACCD